MSNLQTAERTRRRLRIVRWVAIADALLLAGLLTASLMDNRQLVSILGPLHGGNFLLLLLLTGTGASDDLWPWWFPALVLLTAGPLGALIGELILLRRTPPVGGAAPNTAHAAPEPGDRSTQG